MTPTGIISRLYASDFREAFLAISSFRTGKPPHIEEIVGHPMIGGSD